MDNTILIKVKKSINKYPMYYILLFMIIALSILSKDFLTYNNIMNVLIAESSRGILALGVAMVIITRGIDLSVGSIVALASVVSASLVQNSDYAAKLLPNVPTLPVFVGITAGLIAGGLIGAFNGSIVAYRKVPPFIATLGGMVIARGLAYVYTDAYPIPMLSEAFRSVGQGSVGSGNYKVSYVVIIFVFIVIITGIILHKTCFGKSLYAIGGNENAAKVAGIKVEKNTLLAYIFSGVLAAIAGVLLAARSGAGAASLGTSYELDAIAAATIGGVSQAGGVGSISGIFVGIFILGFLNNGLLLLGVSPYAQQIIKGLIIVAAVMLDSRKKAQRS